jgi:hypothetical protein
MRRLAGFAVLVLVAAACGASSDPESTPARVAAGAGSEIAGETLDGERLSLADFRGKPVFVNVWSSW